MSQLFEGVSAALTAILYMLYFRNLVRGDNIPNAATWFIWLFMMTLNACLFFQVNNGDLLKTASMGIAAVGILTVVVYSAVKRKFDKIGWAEYTAVVIAMVVITWRYVTGDAKLALVLVQVAFLISLVPTVKTILKPEALESPLPWTLGVFSYAFLIAGILTGPQYDWVELAYPVSNGVPGNALIAVIAFMHGRKRRKAHG